MNITIFAGDLCDTPAEAICTSTNPRLSLMMGTGAAVRERGGFVILRRCEELVAAAGGSLPAGSAHVTTGGLLPVKAIIHCVASDHRHNTSEAILRDCVRNALLRAADIGCKTLAMPVFGSGHAHFRFEAALRIIAGELS